MERTFGQRLKGYRKAKGLTQQELAEQIGVSDKTVSRWESEGGYPDVTTLVPLARVLGATVDDLLDDKRPVRTLTRTDWQNMLSFAFALGGGVLFFLLDLFMPTLLCYGAYLGCLAYGVYLQKYYAYQSRWFFLGEGLVDLCVNLTVAVKAAVWMLVGSGVVTMTALEGGGTVTSVNGRAGALAEMLWWCRRYPWKLGTILLILVLAVTALTQYLVWWKCFAEGKGFRLGWGKPAPRRLLPALVPLLAGAFWLPAIWAGAAEWAPESLWNGQEKLFVLWLLALGVLGTLPLLKKGDRGRIAPLWLMAALCLGMLELQVYPRMWTYPGLREFPYRAEAIGDTCVTLGQGGWGMAALALGLAAAWVVLSCLRVEGPDR